MGRLSVTLLLLLISGSHLVADDDPKDLLTSIQGDWQRTVERDGTVIRVLKSIGKKQETVRYYIGQQVVYAHQVDFKVSTTAQGNVFSYDRKTITAGPDTGKSDDEPGSYLFKVQDNTWYEVHRMMPGESGAPWITTYERVDKDSGDGRR